MARSPFNRAGMRMSEKMSAVRKPMMPAMHNAKHPGFKAVQTQIAQKQGISPDRAGAILASAARKASPAAVKKNPRLNRVKG